jgi:hypothetical protein
MGKEFMAGVVLGSLLKEKGIEMPEISRIAAVAANRRCIGCANKGKTKYGDVTPGTMYCNHCVAAAGNLEDHYAIWLKQDFDKWSKNIRKD